MNLDPFLHSLLSQVKEALLGEVETQTNIEMLKCIGKCKKRVCLPAAAGQYLRSC